MTQEQRECILSVIGMLYMASAVMADGGHDEMADVMVTHRERLQAILEDDGKE